MASNDLFYHRSEGENGLLIENKFDRHFLREMVTKANIAFRYMIIDSVM